jgi:hypothetical protein
MRAGMILIPDLRDPVLTDAQRRFLEEAERNPADLSVDAVLAGASRRVGLHDFGDDLFDSGDFRGRLARLFGEMADNENLTEFVKSNNFNRCVGFAATRLQAVDLLRRHPEIHEIRIEQPIVIAGLPRSGTTHLLGLISADSRLRSLPYWEVVQPVPFAGEEPGGFNVDPRFRRAEAGWERLQQINPMMAAYHPMEPDHISEDLELQLPDFSTYYWEFALPMPRWRDYFLAHDQTPHYEFEKTMLKILAWQDGHARRFVLKCPDHFEQLRPIMNVFPDATLLFTHRDPVASLQSIVTQLAYVIRTREKEVDPDWYLEYWTDRVERLLRAYLRDIEVVPAGQRLDVAFDEFMTDDLRMVARVYETAGLDMPDDTRAEIEAYRASHRRGKYGAIDHDLRRDFGADIDELRARFDFYVRAVRASPEVR